MINVRAQLRRCASGLGESKAERKSVQGRLEHLNQMLRAIRNVNQLITRERDPGRLLKGVCSTLTETRGFHNAWIALLDDNGRLLDWAESGLGRDFLPMVELLKKGELTRHGRKALGQAGVVVTEDPVSACADCPLSHRYGGRGAMTARLQHGGNVYGLISVSVPAEFATDPEEQTLLQEAAVDIASALHGTELEEEQRRAELALRESDDRYRAVFESTGTATIIIEEDTTISLANQEFERLSGYSREEVEGKKSWTEFVVPEDLERMKEYHKSRRADPASAPKDYESRAVDRQGAIKDILLTIAMIPGTNRSVVSLLDLTERKKTEEALRESEEFRGSLLDNSPAAVLVANEDSSIRYVNRALEERTGFSAAELVGVKAPYPFWPEETRAETEKSLRKAMAEGSHNVEVQLQRKNGERFWAEISGTPVVRDGKYLYYLSNWIEVSERKRAEQEARYQRDYFRSLFNGAPEAVLSIDMERRVMDANPAFEKLFGYPLEGIKGKDIRTSFLPQGKQGEGKDINRIASHGEIVTTETVRRTADGREIPVSLLGAPVIVEGKQVGILFIYRDISERKRAEEELETSRQELRELAAHIESVREEERTGIARELHDEIGQAMTAIKIDLSWLRKELPKDQALLLERTKGTLRVADSAIKTVRKISSELRPGILDDLGLTAAIQWQAGEFEERTGVKCEVSVEREVMVLEQDRSTAVFRIFQEALTNVARHAGATRVGVNLSERDGRLVMEITDNGKGITPSQISGRKAFGLMGMRERAAFLGGQLQISGGPGRGTRVTVSIPLRREGDSAST